MVELHYIISEHRHSPASFVLEQVKSVFSYRSRDLFTQAVARLSACICVREDMRFCSSSWKSVEAQTSLLF